MPVLMEGNLHRVRCFCCKKRGHKAQDCTQKKHRACTICNDHRHRKAACPFHKRGKVEVFVEEETKKEVEDLGKMTLLSILPSLIDLNGPRQCVSNAARVTQGIQSWNAPSTSIVGGAG